MAPTPKPPGARRRKNRDAPTWQNLPEGGRVGPTPELPEGDWLPSTRDWWATVWSSPVALTFLAIDVAALHRLARLRDRDERGDLPVTGLRALQALEDRFGMSPKARRALLLQLIPASPDSPVPRSSVRRLRAIDPSLIANQQTKDGDVNVS